MQSYFYPNGERIQMKSRYFSYAWNIAAVFVVGKPLFPSPIYNLCNINKYIFGWEMKKKTDRA